MKTVRLFLAAAGTVAVSFAQGATVSLVADLRAALADESVAEITITPGTYELDRELVVSRAVVLRGDDDAPASVILTNTVENARVLTVNSRNAVISGLTVTGGSFPSGGDGAGVYLQAGVLTNCIVRGNSATAPCTGVGVWMTDSADALVTHCEIRDNVGRNGRNDRTGVAVYCGNRSAAGKAEVRHSKLVGNRSENGGFVGFVGHGVTLVDCEVSGNTATQGNDGMFHSCAIRRCFIHDNAINASFLTKVCDVRDSLIVRNTSGSTLVTNTKLYNCTVADNTSTCAVSEVSDWEAYNSIIWGNVKSDGVTVANCNGETFLHDCCTTPLASSSSGNIAGDPQFKDAAGGDYRIRFSSPCFNTGHDYGGSSLDFTAVNARVALGEIDRGCYELSGDEEDLGFTAAVADAAPVALAAGETTEIAVSLVASARASVTLTVDWGDGTSTVSNHTASAGMETILLHHAYGMFGGFDVGLTAVSGDDRIALEIPAKFAVAAAGPTILYVGESGSDTNPGTSSAAPKRTLRAAVAAVGAIDGSEIRVLGGTFTVQTEIVLTGAVALRGWTADDTPETDPSKVVLLGDGNDHRILSLEKKGASVSGLTISGGHLPYGGDGAGVRVSAGVVSNCVVSANRAAGTSYGIGVWMANTADALITDSVISGNVAERGSVDGTAVYVKGASMNAVAEVRRSRIEGNSSASGVGGVGFVARNATFVDCEITGNRDGATIDGGFHSCLFRRCRILRNATGRCVIKCSSLDDCVVAANTNKTEYTLRHTALYNCTVVDNVFPNDGYAVERNWHQAYGIYNSVIWGNVRLDGSTNNLSSSTGLFKRNCTIPDAGEDTETLTADPLLYMSGEKIYRPRPGSPLINAGCSDSTCFPSARADLRLTDVTGETARIVGGEIDIGAYESAGRSPLIILIR